VVHEAVGLRMDVGLCATVTVNVDEGDSGVNVGVASVPQEIARTDTVISRLLTTRICANGARIIETPAF